MKVFTPEELEDRKYLESCISLYLHGMLGPYNGKMIELLIKEVERLRKGDFTEEEFQNLCHNFSTEDACRFKQGCIEYQKQLFGDKS